MWNESATRASEWTAYPGCALAFGSARIGDPRTLEDHEALRELTHDELKQEEDSVNSKKEGNP